MKLINSDNIPIVASFIRLYGDVVSEVASHYDKPIIFRRLSSKENEYGDIMGRIGTTVYISEEEVGSIGLTYPEIFASLAHEIGHIVYHTHGWQLDCEHRADMLAAQLGLDSQMISAIEKILDSRRFPNLTSLLVGRIHFLQNMMRG
ncbi:MAG: hypothetical protein HDR88_13330 [Bacteroides sp.]|nr:hypothetical protein [Bacteroides sp.]